MKEKILSAILIIAMMLTTILPVTTLASSNPSSWAVEEVSKAKNEGLVTDSVMMDYQANITREQFCEMVVKAYEKISGENAEAGNIYFSDTSNVEILKAANLGIVTGYGNNVFGPNDLITREQIAAMLVRMIDKSVSYVNINVYNNNNFNDRDYISQWAMPSVNFAYDKGIMQGVGNNCIDPQANTTCEQAILLVYRTTQEYTNSSRIFYEDIDNIKINDEEDAINVIKRKSKEIGIKDIDKELVYTRSETVLGNTFYHFQQIYNDIPVYGRSVTVGTDSSSNAIAISDNYTAIDIDTSVKKKKQDVTEFIKKIYGDKLTSFYIKGLTIYSLNNANANLCWEVNVNIQNDTEVVFISTDALTYYDSVVGNGYDIDDNFCEFNTYTEDNKLFYMEDRENGIIVYDAENGTLKAINVIVDENNNLYQFDGDKEVWVDDIGDEIIVEDGEDGKFILKYTNGNVISKNAYTSWYLYIDKSFLTDKIKKEYIGNYLSDNVFASVSEITNKGTEWKNNKAVTVMDRISKLNSFYYDIFNRVGYDGKYGGVISVINDSFNGRTNAYSKGDWNGTTLLSFTTDCSLSYDLIGHEYRHSVTASIKDGLIYESESGALNEAYSDIFGELFEDWVDDKQLNNSCDWIHNNGRNLINPLESNDPNFYKGANWVDTSDTNNDHGGVHTNQTVISHAAYLMSTGLDIDNSVEHLTNLQLAKLFHTTSYVLPSTCTFEDFSKRLYIIANYMYENNEITEKQLLCVARAFEYVGLPITEQSIFGRVIDKDGNYIDKASVNFSVNGVQISSVETDKDGNFSAKLPVGTYELQINKDGYKPTTQGAKLGINEWFVYLDDIVLEKEEYIPDVVFSSTIGEINGKIYCARKASYTISENGLYQSQDVPTCELLPIKTGAYGIVASFCYYNGYIYYIESEGGTSGYNTALYRCKSDGTSTQLLKYFGEDGTRSFHIDRGRLYYGRSSECDFYIDLTTLQDGYDAWKMYPIDASTATYASAFYYDIPIFVKNNQICKYEGQSYKVLVDLNTSAKTYGNNKSVVMNIDGIACGYIYYSYIDSRGMGVLYRVRIDGGIPEFIDERMLAGGGGPYFCW